MNGADTDNSLWNQAESWGLEAIAEGFRHIGLRDDHEINRAEWIVHEALHAYCQQIPWPRPGHRVGDLLAAAVLPQACATGARASDRGGGARPGGADGRGRAARACAR